MQSIPAARLTWLVAACAAVAGCSGETSIELTLEGDLELGVEADELELSMWRSGAQIWSKRDRPGPGDELPRSHTIERTSEGDRLVELRVAASLYGEDRLEVRREASFVEGERVPVRLCLWRECIGSDRAACLDGACDVLPAADGDGDGDDDIDGDVHLDGDGPPLDGDAPDGADVLCSNDCIGADNGLCTDGGEGASLFLCDYGDDCADCGPRRVEDCIRLCEHRECGPDHCGGTCGPGCGPLEVCAFGGTCIEWVDINPDGPFLMGSPPGEVGHQPYEVLHEVTLTHSFSMMRQEVSQRWFTSLTGSNASSFSSCGPECPMESLAWPRVASVVNYLNLAEGLDWCYDCEATPTSTVCELRDGLASPYECEGYRLPTEAEWEYAARAGTTTATYGGEIDSAHRDCESPNPVLDEIAWFCGNVPTSSPQPRGLLAENAFGLVDMIGNAWEYTHDYYSVPSAEAVVDPWGPATGEHRVYRGGGFDGEGWMCRAAGRGQIDPGVRGIGIGFRLVRTISD